MAQAQHKKNSEVKTSRKTFIIIGVAVLLAAAIAIGITAISGDSTTNKPTTPRVTVEGQVAAGEYQPVIVDGDALSLLGDGSGNPA